MKGNGPLVALSVALPPVLIALFMAFLCLQ